MAAEVSNTQSSSNGVHMGVYFVWQHVCPFFTCSNFICGSIGLLVLLFCAVDSDKVYSPNVQVASKSFGNPPAPKSMYLIYKLKKWKPGCVPFSQQMEIEMPPEPSYSGDPCHSRLEYSTSRIPLKKS